MSNFIKELCRIIYCGTKIIYAVLKRSIGEEVQLSNEMARARYRTRERAVADGAEMSLDEAMKILNLNKLDKREIERQYKHLYEANERSRGGTFYIQSKIVRAKERIDSELSKASNNDTTV